MRQSLLLIVVPLTLILYTYLSSGLGITALGMIDHLAYVLIYVFTCSAIALIRHHRAQTTALWLFVSLNIFVFWGSLLYFRFFKTFAPLGILRQWRDIPSVDFAILSLMRPADFLLLLAVPLLLSFWGIKEMKGFLKPSRAITILPVLALALVSIHWSHNEFYSFRLSQVNLMLNFL